MATCPPACPTPRSLHDYCLGKLPLDEVEKIEAHIASCVACKAQVETLDQRSDTPLDELRRPGTADPFRQEPQLAAAQQLAKALLRDSPGSPKPAAEADFDPYYQWLGIPPREQPPNYYRLLGIELYESNTEVIESVSERQIRHVRSFQAGKHSRESQRLLNELARARVTLADPAKKAAYDAELRRQREPAESPQPATPSTEPATDAWPVGVRPESAEQLKRCLAASGLISGSQFDEFLATLTPAEKGGDAKTLLAVLTRHNRLTAYQARAIYQGQPQGLVLGKHEILEPIGKGGMGHVFRARQRVLDRIEAVKVLSTRRLSSPDAVARFEQEARAAAKLRHENIVETYDAGMQRGLYYLAMEYIDGLDLDQLVRTQGPLPVAQAVVFRLRTPLGDVEVTLDARVTAPGKVEPLVAGKWHDVLKLTDLDRHALNGRWLRRSDGVWATPAVTSRLVVPVQIQGDYELDFSFTRHTGNECVFVNLPIAAGNSCVVGFSFAGGVASGFHRLAGKFGWEDPSSQGVVRPGTLINGQRYRALVVVRNKEKEASIEIRLDGKPYFKWAGPIDLLETDSGLTLPQSTLLAIGAHTVDAVFHEVRLRPLSAAAQDWPDPNEPVASQPPQGIAGRVRAVERALVLGFRPEDALCRGFGAGGEAGRPAPASVLRTGKRICHRTMAFSLPVVECFPKWRRSESAHRLG